MTEVPGQQEQEAATPGSARTSSPSTSERDDRISALEDRNKALKTALDTILRLDNSRKVLKVYAQEDVLMNVYNGIIRIVTAAVKDDAGNAA